MTLCLAQAGQYRMAANHKLRVKAYAKQQIECCFIRRIDSLKGVTRFFGPLPRKA
jgi:hypothetical protein